jgi:hypothetical protein
MRHSALVTGGDALRVEPGQTFTSRANIQCTLDQTTVAAKQAVLHLGDVVSRETVIDPVIVQSQNCAFLNPFAEPANRPGLLRYDGEALSRGLLVWQGEGDFLDRRLAYGIAPATAAGAEAKNWQLQWSTVWGTPGVRKPAGEMLTSRGFDSNKWVLERLAISWPLATTRTKPGADLSLLGVDKKKPAKPL